MQNYRRSQHVFASTQGCLTTSVSFHALFSYKILFLVSLKIAWNKSPFIYSCFPFIKYKPALPLHAGQHGCGSQAAEFQETHYGHTGPQGWSGHFLTGCCKANRTATTGLFVGNAGHFLPPFLLLHWSTRRGVIWGFWSKGLFLQICNGPC